MAALVSFRQENLSSFVEFRNQAASESEWVNSLTPSRAKEILNNVDNDINQQAYLAMAAGKVVGQLFVVYYPGRKTLKVSLISVLQSASGSGTGRDLMDKAFKVAKTFGADTVELHVNSKNTKATGFYEKYGFQLEGKKTTGNLKYVKDV